ncbi:hypothetical protein RRG08_043517 [Elysia crispata]|uniref:Uncharacterized protein n=1 Tax=Elysia crispata TaxID=231223 RepID=A0AAE0YFV7_9GAST|nr:hypothetical protein RRG08_043517 [Elysia crispata]
MCCLEPWLRELLTTAPGPACLQARAREICDNRLLFSRLAGYHQLVVQSRTPRISPPMSRGQRRPIDRSVPGGPEETRRERIDLELL